MKKTVAFAFAISSLITLPVKADVLATVENLKNPFWQEVPNTSGSEQVRPEFRNPVFIDTNGIVRNGDIVTYDVIDHDSAYVRLQTNCRTKQVRGLRRGDFISKKTVKYWNFITPWKPPEGSSSNEVNSFACDKSLTIDPRSEATIAKLNPQIQPYARELVRKSTLSGIQIKITSGLRTYREQDALYCQGRNIPYCKGLYKPGRIVTNAKGGYSNHNFGIAFDIGIFDGNKYLPESPKYAEVGKIGKELGLEWGGDWKTIQDRPHFQLRPQWAANLSESKMLEELRRRTEKNEEFYP